MKGGWICDGLKMVVGSPIVKDPTDKKITQSITGSKNSNGEQRIAIYLIIGDWFCILQIDSAGHNRSKVSTAQIIRRPAVR